MVRFQAKRVVRSVLIAMAAVLLVVFGSGRLALSQQVLTVATEPVYAPFEFQENGEVKGFDVDVIQEAGKAAGFGVKFQNIAFDGIIPALTSGQVDAAIAAMTITQQRSQAVAFSRPYFKAGLGIATRQGAPKFTRLEELKGKVVGVQIGTTGAKAVQDVGDVQTRTYDSAPLVLQAVSNGNVAAAVHDAPILQYALRTGSVKGVQVSDQLLTQEYYGIPTPLNSPNLQKINQGLNTILSNGTYARIYQKWFGTQPPALPETAPGITVENKQVSWFSILVSAFPNLMKGALVTLQITIVSVALGLVLGSLIGIARLSKSLPVSWLARAYVDFFRGTPLLIQIFIIYFGIPSVIQSLGLQFTFNRFLAAVVALSLNSAAYIAEIVRAGIGSIDVGQTEAAQSLGLDGRQTMRHVIFPQAFRRMLPPLGNEFISLLKDTSLVSIIGFEELFQQGRLIVATNYQPFTVFVGVAIVYLVLTLLSSQGFSYLERVMNPVKRTKPASKSTAKPQLQ